MSPAVHVVDVNAIFIGSNGRLKFQSGSVNVRCNTLNGPLESAGPVGPHGPPPDHSPPADPTRPHLMSAEELAEKYLQGYSRERRASL